MIVEKFTNLRKFLAYSRKLSGAGTQVFQAHLNNHESRAVVTLKDRHSVFELYFPSYEYANNPRHNTYDEIIAASLTYPKGESGARGTYEDDYILLFERNGNFENFFERYPDENPFTRYDTKRLIESGALKI